MSNIFGTRSGSSTVTKYTSLNLQTSTAGICIPILYGANRVAPNLIWYNNFQAHASKSGKGGKGSGGKSSGSSSYTYSAAVELALAEGPCFGIGKVWKDQGTSSLAALNLTLFDGTAVQTAPAWVISNYPSEALAYAFTCYLFSDKYDLGSSSNLPSQNFELFGKFWLSMPYGSGVSPDANPADIIYDLLTNTQYGISLDPNLIDTTSLNYYKNYCIYQVLYMSPYLNSQEQTTSILQRWAQLTNTFIFWSGAKLKFVPLISFVGSQTQNGMTLPTNANPVYSLSLEDFIFDDSSEDPVRVTRSDPADGYNSVELDINDRSNDYNTNPVYYRDQSSAAANGTLQSNIISATEVCNPLIAASMASLIGQRTVYLRNSYDFKLPATYALLEPGDIVLITEPNIGLFSFPVRVLTIDEDDKYNLAISAEEFPAGIGLPALYSPPSSSASPPPNVNSDPGDVNYPMIVEPSPIVTAGQPQVWIGLSGGSLWGGAEVWISTDEINYGFLGQVAAPSPQGLLTAILPSHVDPDTVDTLSVSMLMSGQPLSTAVTDADADMFQSVALVGQEMIAFGAVAVTGNLTYNITYLRRGIYNTPISAHPIGELFTFINPIALFEYTLPKSYVGVPLFFKFLSFNLFGRSIQDISTVVEYTYVPTGVAYTIAPPLAPTITPVPYTQPDGTSLISLVFAWGASTGPQVGSYTVQWSVDNINWTGTVVGSDQLNYALTPAVPNSSYWMRVAASSQNGMATSAFVVTGPTNSGNTVTKVPPQPTTLNGVAISKGANLSWPASPDPTTIFYQIWRVAGSGASFYGVPTSQRSRRRSMVDDDSAGRRRSAGSDDAIWRTDRRTTLPPSAVLVATVGALSYSDIGLAGTTAYTYYLVATNSAGSSPPGPTGGTTVTTLA